MNEQTRSCAVIVNSTEEEISISGLSDEDLTIGYGSDIDLTQLVMSFAKLIDTGIPVSLGMPSDDHDERVALVLATIGDISGAYNASLGQAVENTSEEFDPSDDDIPF